MAVRHYFLGANTGGGFVSVYDEFCPPECGVFLWVLKGGPGCGKSSFMKAIGRAAEDAGLDVEYVLCSGDPDSVDGVYVPAWQIAYVDGTAPHVREVPFPAASGAYLDLGQFYRCEELVPKLPELMRLTERYRAHYARPRRCMTSWNRSTIHTSISTASTNLQKTTSKKSKNHIVNRRKMV